MNGETEAAGEPQKPHMKNGIPIYTTAGVLAVSLGAVLWAQNPKADPPPKSAQAWQHLAFEHEGKSVMGSPELARKINSLGDEGWQLVDVESISEAATTTKMIFFFKRLR